MSAILPKIPHVVTQQKFYLSLKVTLQEGLISWALLDKLQQSFQQSLISSSTMLTYCLSGQLFQPIHMKSAKHQQQQKQRQQHQQIHIRVP